MCIRDRDNGTWRRIKVVPFLSTFSDNPDSSNEYSFPIDYGLEDKMIKKWVEPFASMLVQIAYRTGGIIQSKCNIVTAKSQEYRNNQDHILTSEAIVIQCFESQPSCHCTIPNDCNHVVGLLL